MTINKFKIFYIFYFPPILLGFIFFDSTYNNDFLLIPVFFSFLLMTILGPVLFIFKGDNKSKLIYFRFKIFLAWIFYLAGILFLFFGLSY